MWAVCGAQTVTWGGSVKADVCPEPAGKNARNRGAQGSGGPKREQRCNREGKYVSLRLHEIEFTVFAQIFLTIYNTWNL